jgi:electron transfer flavoprotein alpha subunit
MSNILAFIEISNTGQIRKSARSLLTAAAALGTPVADVAAAPGTGNALIEELGPLGAEHVYLAESDQVGTLLVAAQLEALTAAAGELSPAGILLSNSIEGRDVAGRLAVRLRAGLVVDAVDVRLDGGLILATKSVFGGDYTVE